MQLQQNSLFDNHYTLLRQLGRGGFSEVWLAHDSYMDLDVALKIYAPGQGMDSTSIEEFRHEIKDVFNLNHPNLLKPQYLGIFEKMPYLVLSYCSKGSVSQKVGKMSEDEIWHVIHDVASGLAYLHKNDIVHQDIKPDNILIDDSGNYVITDFGISTKARSTLRKSVIGGAVSGGTMAYMGPERFSKQPAPTKASDIWSFGAMIYELITGNVPFGEMGGGMQKGGADIPEIAEPISDKLRQTIEKMLALETWDRPTADELVEIAAAGHAAPSAPSSSRATVRNTIPQQPTEEQPTSSHETQRFAPNAPAETQTISQDSKLTKPANDTANSKSWRWLPIVEIILLLPLVAYCSKVVGGLIGCSIVGLPILCGASALIFIGFLLSLPLLYWLLMLLVTVNTIKKKWVSVVLPIVILAIVGTELTWPSGYLIALIIDSVILIGLWFIFQRRISPATGNEQQKKVLIIILAISYILILGWMVWNAVSIKEEIKNAQQAEEIEAKTAATVMTQNSNNSESVSYSAVDLGLSVRWASCNIGANSPWEIGDYFAWGEITPKSDYTWSSYIWKSQRGKHTKGTELIPLVNNEICGSVNDVATATWGNDWRLPNRLELKELINKGKWEWSEWNGVTGAKVTGPNGNWIFLPAGGFYKGKNIVQKSQYGYYPSGWMWSEDGPLCLWCTNGAQMFSDYDACRGFTIRPVHN